MTVGRPGYPWTAWLLDHLTVIMIHFMWRKIEKNKKNQRFTSVSTEGQVVPDKNIVLSKVSWRPIASIFAKASAAFLTDHNSSLTIHRTNQQHTTPHFHKLRWAVSSQVNQLLNFLVKNHIFNIVTFCAHYNNNWEFFIEFLIVYLTNWCWTPYKKSCWLKLWLDTGQWTILQCCSKFLA